MFSCTEDVWLTKCLGVRTWQLQLGTAGLDTTAREGLVKQWQENGNDFYFAKIDTLNVSVVAQLTDVGFCVVDVNVLMQWQADERQSADNEKANITGVRLLQASDAPSVIVMAQETFRYSRFHLDPNLDNTDADQVKSAWMQNYVTGQYGEAVLVAEQAGKVVGFLAVNKKVEDSAEVFVIDLVGVVTSHQGQGIGEKLVQAFIRQYKGENRMLRVGTQIANIPSIRLYEKCGFRLQGSQYVLHRHANAAVSI